MPTLHRAPGGALEAIDKLLQESVLPTADPGPDNLYGFLVAEDGDEYAGMIRLQIFGTTGQLRSPVVAKQFQVSFAKQASIKNFVRAMRS